MSAKAKKSQPISEKEYDEMWKNPMRRPFLEKIVLNIGVGSGGEELERAVEVLRSISGKEPRKTLSKSNVKEWALREGRPIGAKVTIRGSDAEKLLKRLIIVNNNRLLERSFDNFGNFGFGVQEHISIPQVEYDSTLGIWGLDVTGRLVRPGMRVRTRRINRSKIPRDHYVSEEEAKYFLKKNYNIKIVKKLELDYF